jgi:hypothetical protein
MNVEKDRKEIALDEETVMLPNLGKWEMQSFPLLRVTRKIYMAEKSISQYRNSVWVRFKPDLRS